MEGLELFNLQTAGDEIQKLLTAVVVPLERPGGPVRFAPVQVRVEYFGDRCAHEPLLRRHAHQLVIPLERSIFVRSKIDLLPSRVTYQAPRGARNHGFGNFVDIVETFQRWRNEYQGELKGSLASRWLQPPGGSLFGLVCHVSVTTSVTGPNQST